MSFATITKGETDKTKKNVKEIQLKAHLFDEFLELIEEQYLGRLMNVAENEPNIPSSKAKKLMK